MRVTSANDGLKARARRYQWVAVGLAVLVHAAVFLLTPPFAVDTEGFQPRMVISLDNYASPPCSGGCESGYLQYDTTMTPPQVANAAAVNHRIPRIYPYVLWKYREPGTALLQLTVNASGRIRSTRLMESSDNGTDEAILELISMLRFDPFMFNMRPTAFVVVAEVSVAAPLLGPAIDR